MGNQVWTIFKAHFYKAYCENCHTKQAMSQVSAFANSAVYEENNRYHRETTAAIQTLLDATDMDRIHVANLASDHTYLTRAIKNTTMEMATIKNLMKKIQ